MAKVILIAISLRAGGTERIVSMVANYLCRRHEVAVLLFTDHVPFYQLDPQVELIQPINPPSRRVWWRYYFRMFGHIRSNVARLRPEVLMSFGETISPFVLLTTMFIRCNKLVFNRASPISSLRGKRGVLNRILYPLATTVYLQTESARQLLGRSYLSTNFAVLPNPVDIPDFVPRIEARAKVILSVGYLGGGKNQGALIRAFSKCKDREAWTLTFVGDGPDMPSLQQLVKEVGVERSVRFLGQRSDIHELLLDAQIFAFTSLTEGFPNALAEALAAGCASISFDCVTGPSELISNGRNGILIEVGDEQAFRKALDLLMQDSSLREGLSERAREDIDRFKSDTVLAEFDALVDGPGL